MTTNNNQKKDSLLKTQTTQKSYLIHNNPYFICAFCPVQAYAYPMYPLRY